MAPNAQRILTVLERALTAQDPTASLRALTELRTEIDALERVHVSRALQTGATFADIARPLGISRQAAHRRYRDLASSPPPAPRSPALSAEARAALIRAREEAMRHGSGSIDSEHLLVAIARTARRPLRGLDVESARRNFGPPTVNAPSPSGFRPSLHALLARDDGPLKLDHLLRAALEDPDGGARRLLDRLGVAPEALREAL
jgi:transposase-like protein